MVIHSTFFHFKDIPLIILEDKYFNEPNGL